MKLQERPHIVLAIGTLYFLAFLNVICPRTVFLRTVNKLPSMRLFYSLLLPVLPFALVNVYVCYIMYNV